MPDEAVERRLAAILSADVVGYSRLMAADEEATVRELNRVRERVHELVPGHRGRVVDFTGDNFLAEFPSALDAVRCAQAIQTSRVEANASSTPDRKLELRIGIHVGDVMVEEGRLYGDGVNLSARLQALAEPGGICVSGPVHQQVRHKLDVAFVDRGEQHVKNLPDPVHVFATSEHEGPRPSRIRRRLLASGIFVALAAAGVYFVWPLVPGLVLDAFALHEPLINPPLPEKPSIVVLPFANLSTDPEQEFFSDGMTEDLITDLSKIRNLFVISRNSAFLYKGQTVDVEEVGRELGVRYLLEGSVRKLGSQLRVNAQLIDTTTGFHVWAERYDGDASDLFTVQTDISERILGALEVEIVGAEVERLSRKPTEDLSAYELHLRGRDLITVNTRASTLEARGFFERAAALDPEFAEAIGYLAGSHIVPIMFLWSTDGTDVAKAEAFARHALQLDPEQVQAHVALGLVYLTRDEYPEALAQLDRAVELAPSDVNALAWRGVALINAGSPISGLQSFSRAVRLSPRQLPSLTSGLGYAYLSAGRDAQGIELMERARRESPDRLLARVGLVTIYEARGNHAEAAVLAREILAVNPDVTAEFVASEMGLEFAPAEANPDVGLLELLRRAGLP